VDAPAVKTVQPTVEPAAAINVDTCRLYVKNIPYNSTEGEVRAVFEKYGTVLQLKLPKGRGGTLTGYCFVTFAKPEEAMRAFTELDNRIVMGRIMHLLPAFEEDKPAEQPVPTAETETSSYKKLKKRDMLERLEDQTSWNTLFLNPNSILESVSRKYNLKKREILSQEGDETAVRVAMAETQVIKETKEWLASVGINLDFMQTDRASCERSKHTILVKNIQYKVDEVQLHELFSHYGKVSKVLLAPNRALGIVQFENETHSQNAFKNLSYYKHQGTDHI
jgi:multiple RNA-binding domain-containing protein 1